MCKVMKRYSIITLGCKVNQHESEVIAQHLKASGWSCSNKNENADLFLINTCTVTQSASMQSRQAVRRAIRTNPKARIIVTGCYAQIEPDEIKKIKGVHDIIGNDCKYKIPEIIASFDGEDRLCPESLSQDIYDEFEFKEIPADFFGNRTRPFLKIQDGCNAFCTYCIIPYARGRSRSMPVETVLKNIRQLKKAGYREVVISGIHLGCYGLDLLPKTSLSELIRDVSGLKIIDRVRLSSIEPVELTEDIIKLVAESDNICRHFHIPLQSGDNLILNRMHRGYTRSFFSELIVNINKLIPDAAIGLDILPGFPGETDEAFENTYSLVKDLPVSYLHVFPFSPRKGTQAYSYTDKVHTKVIRARCRKMRELGMDKKKEFYERFNGKTVEVLVENKRDRASNLLKGLTSNYIPVKISGNDDLKNRIVKILIKETKGSSPVYGVICN